MGLVIYHVFLNFYIHLLESFCCVYLQCVIMLYTSAVHLL